MTTQSTPQSHSIKEHVYQTLLQAAADAPGERERCTYAKMASGVAVLYLDTPAPVEKRYDVLVDSFQIGSRITSHIRNLRRVVSGMSITLAHKIVKTGSVPHKVIARQKVERPLQLILEGVTKEEADEAQRIIEKPGAKVFVRLTALPN